MSEQLAIDGGTPVRTEPFGPMHDYGDEEIANLTEVIRSGKLAKGPQISRFERDFADRHGVKWGVTVTSGTAAMHVCIGAINPDPGSEIIVTPWTSAGSIIGMLLHNCVPVFADVDETYNIDPKDVEAKITSRTRAIMAVHLFGNPCDMTTLREIADRHNIFLIEDCCQAHFAEHQGQIVGSIGDIAGFSFGGKHISAGGGGIVLTNNESLGAQATLFMDAALPRDDGPYAGRPYANYRLAPNYKINDLIGAVLNAQLRRADGYIANKIRDAENINAGLEDVEEIVPQPVRPGDRHTY
jgi:perosamine synthetase